MLYILKGDPRALARPRFGNNKVWDSQKQEKLVAGIDLRQQHGDLPFYEGPLHLDVIFFMRIPKDRKKALVIGTYHKSRPDFSNMLKYIEDVATGVLYKDDCFIASVTGKKVYDTNPHIAFSITELDKEDVYEEED